MPYLPVNDQVVKMAKEVIRIQITVLGDCPQCNGANFRSGVCEDCGYISPEVLEVIKEWQESQGLKSASVMTAFVDMFPAPGAKNNKCPRCGRSGFDVQCENPQCAYEEPPSDLNHRQPKYIGIDPKLVKNVRRRFLHNADVAQEVKQHRIELKKKKNKKKIKKSFKLEADKPQTSGLDNVTTIETDPSNRIHQMELGIAQIDFENKNAESPDSN